MANTFAACCRRSAVFHAHHRARRVHLIWDGGSPHTSKETLAWLRARYPHVRALVTPPHVSWLNQAELLRRAVNERYLKRVIWKSCQQLVEHLDASWREYNERFAHPVRSGCAPRALTLW